MREMLTERLFERSRRPCYLAPARLRRGVIADVRERGVSPDGVEIVVLSDVTIPAGLVDAHMYLVLPGASDLVGAVAAISANEWARVRAVSGRVP